MNDKSIFVIIEKICMESIIEIARKLTKTLVVRRSSDI